MRKVIVTMAISAALVAISTGSAFANSYTNTKLPTTISTQKCASVKLALDLKAPSSFTIVQTFDSSNAVDPGEGTNIIGLGGWDNSANNSVAATTVYTTADSTYVPQFMKDYSNGKGTVTICMDSGDALLTSVYVANITPLAPLTASQ